MAIGKISHIIGRWVAGLRTPQPLRASIFPSERLSTPPPPSPPPPLFTGTLRQQRYTCSWPAPPSAPNKSINKADIYVGIQFTIKQQQKINVNLDIGCAGFKCVVAAGRGEKNLAGAAACEKKCRCAVNVSVGNKVSVCATRAGKCSAVLQLQRVQQTKTLCTCVKPWRAGHERNFQITRFIPNRSKNILFSSLFHASSKKNTQCFQLSAKTDYFFGSFWSLEGYF